jgi:hypothetical protein
LRLQADAFKGYDVIYTVSDGRDGTLMVVLAATWLQ